MLFVIVPFFNVEKFLKDCLDSIAWQSFRDFRCILINDGSTDASPKIAQDFCNADARFMLINKENGGISSARNAGLDVASKIIEGGGQY